MNIITIGRQFGSGGRELGKRLADSLGYKGDRLMTPFFPGHAHEERAWASRVSEPLKFILKK